MMKILNVWFWNDVYFRLRLVLVHLYPNYKEPFKNFADLVNVLSISLASLNLEYNFVFSFCWMSLFSWVFYSIVFAYIFYAELD